MPQTHGFELLQEKYIPELNLKASLYRHIKTKAELLSLENDDENKAFGISFRTPPSDSTGVAHIMEHAVLCGSRKYPTKEPFVELVKGSLKTFLNAFTSPDKTTYPIASTNTQDFYNLIDVYLDAVFYPRITPETLQQEGWHYEMESEDAPLTRKGVVFNEMKGVYSSPDNLLGKYEQELLFPNNSYRFDYGGDPKHIPDLTYEQFKTFHQTYYHPSNSRLFFYGDDNPETRLKIANEYLKDFDYLAVNSQTPLHESLSEPQKHTFSYAVAQGETDNNKSMLSVNWLLPEGSDMNLVFALSILSQVLLGTPASPLRKTLIDSGLGEDLTGGGLSTHLRQMTFSTGLKGIDLQDADKVENLILDTLADLAQNGIEPEMIEASVNTLEFRLREQNTGRFPRGLALSLGALGTWIHNGDPIEALAFEAPLTTVKAQLAADSNFLPNLIQEHLLKNPHRVTVILKPDPEQQQREEAAEQAKLAQIKASMTNDELKEIMATAKKLKTLQETPDSPEALATIPHLELSDLDKENKPIPISLSANQDSQILYHDLFTNGIIYLDVGFNLHTLPQELLPYVSLFSQALLEIGTEKEDFVKLTQRIGRTTGGIWSNTYTSAAMGDDKAVAWLFLRGKATMAHADDLLDILQDVLLTVQLDNKERFKQMVLEDKADQEAGLIPGGHSVVNSRLRAHFSEADWVSEEMDGLSNLFFVRQLAQQIETDWPGVLEKLETIRRILINRKAMLCNITLDSENWAVFQPKLSAFIGAMPAQPVNIAAWTRPPFPANEGLTIPAQVNYVAKGANLYNLGYKHHGSISAISNFIRNTWLWEQVRVQGGAYGAFFSFDQFTGVLTFISYRDPNLGQTLDVYDNTAQFLRQVDLNKSELSKSIIGAISQMDAYLLPDAKGYTSMARYLIGYTDEERQRIRDEVLAATPEDFKAFADILDAVKAQGIVTVLGSQDAIAKANESRADKLQILKVM